MLPEPSGRPKGVQVRANGTELVIEAPATVAELVRLLVPDARLRRGIAVARNMEVVPRSRWESEKLSEGDSFELLSPAQGG